MTKPVTETERAYLILVARRALHFRREAEKQGQEYQELEVPVPLESGHSVHLRFLPSAAGYQGVVKVWIDRERLAPGTYADAVKQEIAQVVLGGPVEAHETVAGTTVTYTRVAQ